MHYLNGDWSGLSIEHEGMHMKNPLAGVLGNAVLLVTNNFVPTFFPMAHWWNEHALSHFPSALVRLMDANFEVGYNTLGEMPTEDSAGIGFGISVLVVISMVAGRFLTRNAERGTRKGKSRNEKSEKRESGKAATARTRHDSPRRSGAEAGTRASQLSTLNSRLVLAAPWIALLVYCMKSGMVTPGRLIAPYYPLLFPLLLVGIGQSQIVRRCWWRILAGGVFALALAALILNPSRPLWPANTIMAKLVARYPGQAKLMRAQKVYEVYGHRADPMPEVRQWFPQGLKVIGFMGFADDLDISMWKPYGSRRVEPFLISDSPETIRKLGMEYAVVSGLELHFDHVTIDEWLQKSGAELINSTTATTTVSMGPQPWYFVRFKK
jgi:hypothetical protein